MEIEIEKENIMKSWMKSLPQKYKDYLGSKIVLDQYFISVHEYYREKEKQFSVYHFQSPELHFRVELVRWMKALQNEINFSPLALHLSVYLLDHFMDNHMIPIDKLSKVALVCIILANSVEDLNGSFPQLPTIYKKIGQEYNRKDVVRIQSLVFKFYDFYIGRPTVAHFAQMYSAFIIDLNDFDSQEVGNELSIDLFNNAEHRIDCLLDDYLNEVQYLKFENSMVAAFFILLARKFLDLQPYWTKLLQFITGYNVEDFHPCIALYNSLQESDSIITELDIDTSGDDSGYTTSGSCQSPSSKLSTSINSGDVLISESNKHKESHRFEDNHSPQSRNKYMKLEVDDSSSNSEDSHETSSVPKIVKAMSE